MKITIDIPQEFEYHFNNDFFEDSLKRLKADAGTFYLAGAKEIKLCEMLIKAFRNAENLKYGRWDTHDVVKILCSGEMLDGFCQCENCGDVFPYQFSEYPYCPSCGARMDKEAEQS